MQKEEIMARIVKAHAVRRNEILDVAQRLIYTEGYEQMTIQDILDGLQIPRERSITTLIPAGIA